MASVSSLLSQVNAVFAEKEKQLKQAEVTLEHEVAALAKEKELMATIPTADNDVVYLNVGGTICATKRSTLTQAQGSMLAAWFSGRWEHGLDHDDEGRIFLDFDPDLFQPILSFLRSRAICSNPDVRPTLVGVDASKQRAFADLVKYLALEEYLGYEHDTGSQPLMPSFARASVTATISENRQIATVTRDTGNKWPIILVEPSCSSCCFLKFKITDWPQQPVFVGLGANFDVGKEARYFETAHGWMLGLGGPSCSASCFVKGTMGAHVADRIIKRNGWVLVKADFNSQKLVIRTSESSRSYDIPLEVADHEPLFFAIGLNSVGDHVELLPVTPEDQALFK